MCLHGRRDRGRVIWVISLSGLHGVRQESQPLAMNEHHANVIVATFGRTTPPSITWRRALPRGNLFLFCVRPDRHLTSLEQQSIRTFCNQQVGVLNWHMAPGEDFIAFRSLDDLTTFLEQF
jgi:hypothetical protein